MHELLFIVEEQGILYTLIGFLDPENLPREPELGSLAQAPGNMLSRVSLGFQAEVCERGKPSGRAVSKSMSTVVLAVREVCSELRPRLRSSSGSTKPSASASSMAK